tara:strand:- start:2480 stop:2662 length:183 start_codon:yes stop_codon:yes gene_type:complete
MEFVWGPANPEISMDIVFRRQHLQLHLHPRDMVNIAFTVVIGVSLELNVVKPNVDQTLVQ